MSCNLLIVEPSLVLLKPPTLGGVFPRCGSLHLNFSDLYLDEIANGDETDQPVSLNHRHLAAPARRHF